MACKDGNHVIGCGYEGHVTLYQYVESRRKHPGMLFSYCPKCGERFFISDAADAYEKTDHGKEALQDSLNA